jgi:diguanylate cyclase (GGDEF)-like protein
MQQAADLLFLLLDLDHFKSVNDTYGHAAGDAVLVQTAAALRRVVRAADHVVRWGGEEFLVVARFVERGHGPELAEKVRAEIAGTAFALPGGETLRRTCSLGFAAFPFDLGDPQGLGWERVVHAADLCLYLAKRRGRDGWVGVAAGGARGGAAALAELERDAEAAEAAGAVRLVASRAGDVRGWRDGAGTEEPQ